MNYEEFLSAKVPRAELMGFTPASAPHPSLFPHQRDIAAWCCRGGQRAVFAAFGLGKTRIHLQVAKWVIESEPKKKYLIIAPLGVRQEFTRNDAPAMGMEMQYCRTDAEVAECKTPFIITNYERVRDGGITINGDVFAGVGLDEASVLRSFGSKTYQTFLTLFKSVRYRFVFTATPSPNKHKELIHYGGFLGVMDTGEALTRFFKRDSTQANNLTLYPHMEERFWLWLSSWAVFMQKPSDLGYPDEGYDLPPIKIHWHRVAVDHRQAWKQCDSWGQHQLFQDQSNGLRELAEVKRDTAISRLAKAIEIMDDQSPFKHWILWHELEVERHLITRAVKESKAVYGSQDLDERENLIMGFAVGDYRILSTKPILAGSGCNFQKHCSDAIFLGASYKFNDVIQAVHRIQRFQQTKEVNIHFIYSESEQPVVDSLKEKWAQHDELVERMADILKKNKLSLNNDMKLTRDMGCDRSEVTGEVFRMIHNDCIIELMPIEGGEILQKESREKAGNKSQICGEKQGVDCSKNKSLVSKKQADCSCESERIHSENEIRNDAGNIPKDVENSEEQMRNLCATADKKDTSNRPLPQDREGSRDSVLPVQYGIGAISGRSKIVIKSGDIPKEVGWSDNCVDLIVTSIPFGNQYEYSPSYNDLGQNPNNHAFFNQLDFLVPNLLRVLKPGRLACIHVKDRIRFGNVTGLGMPTVDRFSDKTADCFEKHGFAFMGRITIDTDVVRENNQTYRLGWTENSKDSSKMGVGMPEYVIILRKLPTDLSDAYADTPVRKDKAQYTRAQWQIDAASLWKSDGNRLPDPELLLNMPMDAIKRLWIEHCHKHGYNHQEHIEIGKELEKLGKLPASFMLFPPISNHPDIWTDIVRMRTLNSDQSKRHQENHVCPLQLDIIERLINRYSNPGEIVLDPFGGIGSVPYQAIKLGRTGWGIELNEEYWSNAVGYCEQAESERVVPNLFDMETFGVKVISA